MNSKVFYIDDRGDLRHMATGAFYRKATREEMADQGPGACITECDPDMSERVTVNKTEDGVSVKHDNGKVKAAVLAEFSDALTAVAEVGTFGVSKYSRGAWLGVPNAKERYTDAMWRHLLAEASEASDSESGLLHAAHMAWNALARLQLELNEQKGE